MINETEGSVECGVNRCSRYSIDLPAELMDRVQRALRAEGLELSPYIRRGKHQLRITEAIEYRERGDTPAGFVPRFLRYGTVFLRNK